MSTPAWLDRGGAIFATVLGFNHHGAMVTVEPKPDAAGNDLEPRRGPRMFPKYDTAQRSYAPPRIHSSEESSILRGM